jgi:hypothetical protein
MRAMHSATRARGREGRSPSDNCSRTTQGRARQRRSPSPQRHPPTRAPVSCDAWRQVGAKPSHGSCVDGRNETWPFAARRGQAHRALAPVAPGDPRSGEVAEWFKAPVLKTGVGASLPWVRIPPSPPVASVAQATVLSSTRELAHTILSGARASQVCPSS